MRITAYIAIIASLLLVTFFGMGPVLLADGSITERVLTLAAVIIIYVILIILLKVLLNSQKRR
ncbi:MAG: hypothetical protein AB7G87_03350 [Clostridia bacterium]